MEPKPHPDWKLILHLGGPGKVAERLGFEEEGRVQRVQNWKFRGIPAIVQLERPDLFGAAMRAEADAATEAAEPEQRAA